MSRICELCGRAYNQAISRSHSNIATKRRQLVNLQTRNIAGVRARVCTRCVRTLKKNAILPVGKTKTAGKSKSKAKK